MDDRDLYPHGWDGLGFDKEIIVYDGQCNAYRALPRIIHTPGSETSSVTPNVLSRTPGRLGENFSRPMAFSPTPKPWHWSWPPRSE